MEFHRILQFKETIARLKKINQMKSKGKYYLQIKLETWNEYQRIIHQSCIRIKCYSLLFTNYSQ